MIAMTTILTGEKLRQIRPEPRSIGSFRKVLHSSPKLFLEGTTLVCTDADIARDVLAFRPDIFEDRALLGTDFKKVKPSRSQFRALSSELAPQIDSDRLKNEILKASRSWPAPASFIIAALNVFGSSVIGRHYDQLAKDAAEFVIAGVDRHKFQYRRRNRLRLNESFFRRLEQMETCWDEPGTLAHTLLQGAPADRTPRETAMLIAAGLMSVSAPPGFSAAWMAYEARAGGPLNQGVLNTTDPMYISMEVLRLRPPAWNHGRTVVREGQIGGIELLPQMQVLVPVGYIHTDPTYWEAPLEFKPSRWTEADHTSSAFFPFGVGRRACVGGALGTSFLTATAELLKTDLQVSRPRGRFRVGPLYGPQDFALTERG
ncbi:cytochrome P450 [Glutamicibacter sp. MCAF14]|uniref:cytochrome P450 n=1 Tax=Glutamicibacter sp. MCAF14 TaxID=3233043 RepID=UPI003F8F0CDB